MFFTSFPSTLRHLCKLLSYCWCFLTATYMKSKFYCNNNICLISCKCDQDYCGQLFLKKNLLLGCWFLYSFDPLFSLQKKKAQKMIWLYYSDILLSYLDQSLYSLKKVITVTIREHMCQETFLKQIQSELMYNFLKNKKPTLSCARDLQKKLKHLFTFFQR